MNALHEAAKGVQTAWCQGDLRKEAQSAEEGDSFCAVGQLADVLSKSRGLKLTKRGAFVGTPEDVDTWDEYIDSNSHGMSNLIDNLQDTYHFISSSPETRVLSEVIQEKYPDRNYTGYSHQDIIWLFNDDRGRTRDEIVEVMNIAAERFDEEFQD